MLVLEIVQPGQQHIAPQVRGDGNRQRARNRGLVASHRVLAGFQRGDRRPGVLQVAFPIARQPQAARRAHEQARLKRQFQPFERGAGHGGRQVQFARSGGKAAVVSRRHEDPQVLEPDHDRLIFKKVLKLSRMLAGFSSLRTG
ncbi:hypothetical protein G6F31_020142 [Rhizopus arrhizus]|nr:hypothetical protein G6F31_020142 [Rhizopus arrhizus]